MACRCCSWPSPRSSSVPGAYTPIQAARSLSSYLTTSCLWPRAAIGPRRIPVSPTRQSLSLSLAAAIPTYPGQVFYFKVCTRSLPSNLAPLLCPYLHTLPQTSFPRGSKFVQTVRLVTPHLSHAFFAIYLSGLTQLLPSPIVSDICPPWLPKSDL